MQRARIRIGFCQTTLHFVVEIGWHWKSKTETRARAHHSMTNPVRRKCAQLRSLGKPREHALGAALLSNAIALMRQSKFAFHFAAEPSPIAQYVLSPFLCR